MNLPCWKKPEPGRSSYCRQRVEGRPSYLVKQRMFQQFQIPQPIERTGKATNCNNVPWFSKDKVWIPRPTISQGVQSFCRALPFLGAGRHIWSLEQQQLRCESETWLRETSGYFNAPDLWSIWTICDYNPHVIRYRSIYKYARLHP